MKIFISWSGERSRAIAAALREWIPRVIQSVRPWYSEEDIDKGARWSSEVGKQLESITLGIICVTPENAEAPWLIFEAGALSRILEKSAVCPFLMDLQPTDLRGPLAQFQATRAEKGDVLKLMHALNRKAVSPIDQAILEEAFDAAWQKLERSLAEIRLRDSSGPHVQKREPADLIPEILERVRSIERRLLAENPAGRAGIVLSPTRTDLLMIQEEITRLAAR